MSWLTALNAGLVARFRRFFPVVGIVALALMMVVPPVLATGSPEAEVHEVLVDGAGSPVQDTLLQDPTWSNSTLLLAPLYLRIPAPQLLNSSMRQEIYTYVNHNPGATFTEVRTSVGAATGTIQHHLRVLVRGGVLRRVRTGKYTRYYPFNHRVLALGPSQERLVRSLVAEGPGTQAELARRTGMSRQLVHYHVGRLESQGLVRVERDCGPPRVMLGGPNPSPPTNGCWG